MKNTHCLIRVLSYTIFTYTTLLSLKYAVYTSIHIYIIRRVFFSRTVCCTHCFIGNCRGGGGGRGGAKGCGAWTVYMGEYRHLKTIGNGRLTPCCCTLRKCLREKPRTFEDGLDDPTLDYGIYSTGQDVTQNVRTYTIYSYTQILIFFETDIQISNPYKK